MAKITIKGEEYELSTKLRVAFLVQGANNHKPYSQVFKEMGKMPIEKQIEILYLAFKTANPEEAKLLTLVEFQNTLLDDSGILQISEILGQVVEGIMYHGLSPEEIEAKKQKAQEQAEAMKNAKSPGTTSSDEDIE